MEAQVEVVILLSPRVKAALHLGSESYFVEANEGLLSDQLVSMKGQSMDVLKQFITQHNVPNDVPDEPDDITSDDDG